MGSSIKINKKYNPYVGLRQNLSSRSDNYEGDESLISLCKDIFVDGGGLLVTPNGFGASVLNAAIPTDGSGDGTCVRATTGTRVNENGYIEEVAANVPRINWNNGVPAILCEPQRTNALNNSNDFTSLPWRKEVNDTISANIAISPDGGLNASKLIPSSTFGQHWFYILSQPTVIGNTYTWSIFVKADGYNYASLRIIGASVTASSRFDLSTGDSESLVGTSNFEYYGNGWYRCSVTCVADDTDVNIYVNTNSVYSFADSYAGNGVDGMLHYGAQFEEGSYPTSYIPTAGTTVTRNTDLIDSFGDSSSINSEAFTFYSELKLFNKTAGDEYIISISDGTINNRFLVAYNTAGFIQVRTFVAGAIQLDYTNLSPIIDDFFKLAVRVEVDNFSVHINGVEVHSSNSGLSFPASTLNELAFERIYNGTRRFEGEIRTVQVYPKALINTELEKLTS